MMYIGEEGKGGGDRLIILNAAQQWHADSILNKHLKTGRSTRLHINIHNMVLLESIPQKTYIHTRKNLQMLSKQNMHVEFIAAHGNTVPQHLMSW